MSPAVVISTDDEKSSTQNELKEEKKKKKKEKKKRKEKEEKKRKRNDDDTKKKKKKKKLSSDDGEESSKKKKEKKKRKDDEKEKHLHDDDEPKLIIVDGSETKDKKNDKTSSSNSSINSDDEEQKNISARSSSPTSTTTIKYYTDDKMIQSSNLDFCDDDKKKIRDPSDTTLLLFYQYVEPPWDDKTYKTILQQLETTLAKKLGGRMRVAKEGLNCTLTGTHEDISQFCKKLRNFRNGEFQQTEFKLTKDLPMNQRFPNLKVMPVSELVNYGLEKETLGGYSGIHLDPKDYHNKMTESDTVVIDVRNHYESQIGRFDISLDPQMRKSTEFPVWLDKESTKEKLRGKQVLMYCTGGIRCERASALLNYKMENDPDIKDLGIQGVYQLQGGIDKYFKEFPDGGHWSGKNYTFDKRFAHAPPKIDAVSQEKDILTKGKCEACSKAWDKFGGKRRCPTCGVPSLICKECMLKHKSGEHKLDNSIRCDLCVSQNIRSKAQLRNQEEKEMNEYEQGLLQKGLLKSNDYNEESISADPTNIPPNPENVTRLFLKNMCRKFMDQHTLCNTLPGITHIVWRMDRKTQQFFGQAWVEMATPEDAARAVGMNGISVLSRPLSISYQPPDGKDRWPPNSSRLE